MRRLVVTCPECSARLEAPSDDLGRDGQCPACQRIFCIRPSEGAGWILSDLVGDALEQRDAGLAAVPFVMSGCLVVLILATFAKWANPFGSEMAFVGTDKILMAAISVACLLFLAASALTQACAAPAALLAGTWGVATTCWLFGLRRFLGQGAETYGTFQPLTGLHAARLAGVLLVAATAYAYGQYRRTGLLRQPAAAFLSSGGLGLVVGITVLLLHAAPASTRALAMARARSTVVTPKTTLTQGNPRPVPPAVQGTRPTEPVDRPAPTEPPRTVPSTIPGIPVPTEAVATVDPPDVEPVPFRWIWIEGEDALEQDCVVPREERGIAWQVVSGGRWLSHYPHLRSPERPAEAHYTFVAEEPSGYYSLWVRAYPMKDITSIQVRIDDRGSAKYTGRAAGTNNARTSGSQPVAMGWGFFGKHEIAGGTHSLTIHFPDWVRPSAVDCLLFTESTQGPAGKEKPDSKQAGRRR
jgi:hypothetical protein